MASNLYEKSGVNTEKGDTLVSWLQGSGDENSGLGEVVSGIGGFAGLFRPDFSGMRDPLLVGATDGVGTKVLLALEHKRLSGVGIDLVAMCVNDLYTLGARPLFFLDYYATGVLDEASFKEVLGGIRQGLRLCHTPLLGGETAEMPGLYSKGHFDLAGFVVGVVDGPERIRSELVQVGDVVVGFASSGFHSNGYSLLRKWVARKSQDAALMDRLLTPTRIYHELPELVARFGNKVIHGLAHITGGGISGNLPRVLPEGTCAVIEKKKLPTPAWMQALFTEHDAVFDEVEGVFNLGVGIVAVVGALDAEVVIEAAVSLGLEPVPLGVIEQTSGPATVIYR